MVAKIRIENLPEEIGEETTLANRDDGTICSKVLGSTDGKNIIREMEARNEDSESKTESGTKPEETSDKEEDAETEEREFDKNPTVLYALVQKKLWKEAIARAKSNPKEARAFICRREKDGRIRWRLLPLHAAVVFKAPEAVIETLLSAFPKASKEKDDQGMLPLHLAFRNGATEEVVNLLLLAFPQSVDSPDRKGRVPLTLAKVAAPPKREMYIKALEKGPSHYAVTALACARERIEAEQKEIFDAKLAQARQFQECALAESEANAEKKQQELHDKVAEKEQELTKIHQNSQVLVEHVTSLEAQMNTRSDTERFLATKIAKLELNIKQNEVDKGEREQFWKNYVADMEGEAEETKNLKAISDHGFEEEKAKFNTEKESLLAKLDQTQNVLSSTQDKLVHSIETMNKKGEDWDAKEKKMQEMTKQIEIEWANAQANCAILDSQLKKRMENEHLLATQVSALAKRLAESAENAMKFTREIKELELEKHTHQTTVDALMKRLHSITGVLENTRQNQMTILDDAILQEEMMAKSMENHAKVVSESLTHERELQEARAKMMALVEQSFDTLSENRLERLNFASEQGQYLSNMNNSRQSMFTAVKTVTTNVMGAIATELNLSTKEEMKSQESVEQATDASEEIREEAEEMEAVEESCEKETTGTKDTEETIEVVVSPKKSISIACDVVAEDDEEEGRADETGVRPEEIMTVSRVTAE